MSGRADLGWCRAWPLLLAAVLAGCDDGASGGAGTKTEAKPAGDKVAEGKKVPVGDNVDLEVFPASRRVLVYAQVCLREGPLEQLLTRRDRKEHEAILAANVDARKIHEALILAGAKEGKPVRWQPKYVPPSGTKVKVSLRYKDKAGKQVVVPARSWIRELKTKKELSSDWVFAGSTLVENPLDKNGPKEYTANQGDVICVANFESALLDVPTESSDIDANRGYEAWTERIPPVGTKVVVILEPVVPAKKK